MKRIFVLFAVLGLLAAFAVPVMAQDGGNEGYPVNTITVTGTGDASGTPDIANLEIGVDALDPEVSAAFNRVNETIDAVIAAIVEAGVPREDIRTSGLNIYQERGFDFPVMAVPGAEGDPNGQIQFRVSNQVQVTVRDISLVADVINAAVGAGATNMYGLNFSIDDRVELENVARIEAMEDAQNRAQALADLIGAELGEAIIVTEGGSPGFFFNSPFATADRAMGGGGAIIEPGQLLVTTQVTVTYRISR